jgi:hypothetical protein
MPTSSPIGGLIEDAFVIGLASVPGR